MNDPHERLRHHVTGAIERGEATAIEAVDAKLYTIIDNGEEHGVSAHDYDRLIAAELIYYCDECNIAHAVDDWSSVERFLKQQVR